MCEVAVIEGDQGSEISEIGGMLSEGTIVGQEIEDHSYDFRKGSPKLQLYRKPSPGGSVIARAEVQRSTVSENA